MLTCDGRERLARHSIACFRAQTWPDKELVIVNSGTVVLGEGDPRIKEVFVTRTDYPTLGDLRRLSVELATGDFVIQWDDDDWHSSYRTEISMEAWKPGHIVTFVWQVRCNLFTGEAFYDCHGAGQHMSVLFRKQDGVPYTPVVFTSPTTKGEDTVLFEHFGKNVVAIPNNPLRKDVNPMVYIHFYHGLNLWCREHTMGGSHLRESKTAPWQLSGLDRVQLNRLLAIYREEKHTRISDTIV